MESGEDTTYQQHPSQSESIFTQSRALQRAAHLWSQSEKGNTSAWQDPRDKGKERRTRKMGQGLKPSQETTPPLNPAVQYGTSSALAKPLTQISTSWRSQNHILVSTARLLKARICQCVRNSGMAWRGGWRIFLGNCWKASSSGSLGNHLKKCETLHCSE